MKGEKQTRGSWKRFFIWVGAVVAIALAWDRWNGAFAVSALCKRDGGEHILETAFASGYLVEDTQDYLCLSCIEMVGRRQFEYADALVRSIPRRQFPPNSYLRYSVGVKGGPDCEYWTSRPEVATLLREAGIAEHECVRITLLPGKPTGYALVNSRSKFSVRGAEIALNEWRVEEVQTNRVLANVRDYQFTSTLTAVMDMSGHGGNPESTCLTGDEYVNALANLRSRVLRDPAKRPIE